MTLPLDTHVALWALTQPHVLVTADSKLRPYGVPLLET